MAVQAVDLDLEAEFAPQPGQRGRAGPNTRASDRTATTPPQPLGQCRANSAATASTGPRITSRIIAAKGG